MASTQEKVAPLIHESLPLTDTDCIEDYEEADTSHGCLCFPGLCFRSQRNNNGSRRYLLHKQEETKEGWIVERLKKLKEISEVLAGPKWKNFLRRFNVHGFNKKRRTQYQYDPQSYALNFDEGIDRQAEGIYPYFLDRYAAPAGMNKGDPLGT